MPNPEAGEYVIENRASGAWMQLSPKGIADPRTPLLGLYYFAESVPRFTLRRTVALINHNIRD